MNNGIVLLRALLMSTSGRNIRKHSTDKKKRRRIIGNAVGVVVLYAMLMALCVAMCIGFGRIGLVRAVPEMCALMISALAFVFTLFKTNSYLFNFREYDMLMSLPLESRTVAGCKFLYMYIKSLAWYASISLAMLIGYGVYARPSWAIYPVWIVLSLLLPLIPMLIASFLGFLIARISSGFRRTNAIQTVLTLIFTLAAFSLRFVIEDLLRNNRVEATLQAASALTGGASRVYLPAAWFTEAVTKGSMSSMLLLAGVSIALFSAVFAVVGRSYRSINSALKSHAAARRFRMSAQKQRGVVRAIAFKEFRRMTGSTAYLVNAGIGVILAALVGLLTLVIGPDRIIQVVTHDAPVDPTMLHPAIPFIVYFFIGMVATTACSPSLEGKNYWILQSLPIEKKTVYQGKMLYNMAMTVPFMAFSTLCLCVAGKVPAVETALYLLLGLTLCAFSTAWGCVCGIKHMRLDWENEIEVIKQGAAVAIYMLPNMFVVMGLAVLSVVLGLRMNRLLLALIFTAAATLLAALSYWRAMALARRDTMKKRKSGTT